MQYWTKDEIKMWQMGQFQKLAEHVSENVPYYDNLFADNQNSLIIELAQFPKIEKETLIKKEPLFTPNNLKKNRYKLASTGGTSGSTLRYRLDLKSWSFTTAYKIFYWQKIGYKYGDKYASIGSTSLFSTKPTIKHRIYSLFKRSYSYSSIELSDEKIEIIVNDIEKRKIKYVYGYASGLYLIAKYLKKKGKRISHIEACFPTSEILIPKYRSLLEEVFSNVMDGYGARDGGIVAFETGKSIYEVGYNTLVEVGNDKTLLVTDLFNYASPFIRYCIGDKVDLGENTNNYNGDSFTKIHGRTSDIIYLDNGKVLTGPAFTVLFGKLNVDEYRLTKISGLKILIEITVNEKYDQNDDNVLVNSISNHIGHDCLLEVRKVEKMLPGKNGKRNYFLS
jgi:phenylacetate-CoA ligase